MNEEEVEQSVTKELFKGDLRLKLDLLNIERIESSCEMRNISVLEEDRNTPDCHVKRDPRMIRLTGTHPFNSEPPLAALRDGGFITPTQLHFVRNHGSVPKDIPDEDWKISIEGLVEYPMIVTLADIKALVQITVPVTLVCAGNRRKEQNVVQKGNGFNWGAAGVSNALFTGPLLRDLIKLANPTRNAKYVCMEGKDVLPNGNYGTCVSLKWVNDGARKIMLAHKMNGTSLEPDHGRPIRVIVPGCIGGRSVKWLARLILTDSPSKNYYHLYDNRVLPTMVTPSIVKNDKSWWMDERYAIYNLNVQSAITFPNHDELITIKDKTIQKLSGYAYSGGGRRVGRVEVSLDKGASWLLADIEYPEDEFRKLNGSYLCGGMIDLDEEHCFSWCFWTLEVEISNLVKAKDVVVRAMDEAMNLQPRDMYWNTLSMLNNCWYRIAIFREGETLRFEHPCLPALAPGGWMERVKREGGDLLGANWGEITDSNVIRVVPVIVKTVIQMINIEEKRVYSMDQVALHKSFEDAWFVVKDHVYDGTAFLKDHPGGADSIVLAAGKDATEDFMAIHSESAVGMLRDYHIGALDLPVSLTVEHHHSDKHAPTFLSEFNWKGALLVSKVSESANVRIFRYRLEDPEQTLGLPCGMHIFIRVKDLEGRWVIRAYTPVSPPSMKGHFELLVKLYPPVQPTFPNGGKMTMLLDNQAIDSDEIQVKGPLGSFQYLGNGLGTYRLVPFDVNQFCCIAAGSGITPILQVISAVLGSKDDKTVCHLIDANQTLNDILCLEQLSAWRTDEVDRFKLTHAISRPPPNWDEGVSGYITLEVMRRLFPEPTARTMLLACGPPGLMKVVEDAGLKLGWKKEQIVLF